MRSYTIKQQVLAVILAAMVLAPIQLPATVELRRISSVRIENDTAKLSFVGKGTQVQSLMLAYGDNDGGEDLAAWDASQHVAAIARTDETVTVALPEGWGETVTYAAFFLIDGVCDTADAYVQEGLIAQWDAGDNVATGVHATDSMVWVDRIARREIALNEAQISERDICLGHSSISFGTLSESDSDALFASENFTIEIVCQTEDSNFGTIFATPRKYGVSFTYWSPSVLLMQSQSPTLDVTDKELRRHPVTLSAAFGETGVLARFADGESDESTAQSYMYESDPALSTLACNGFGNNGTVSYSKKVHFGAIRVYSRVLDAREAEINAAVDGVRFGVVAPAERPASVYRISSSAGRLVKVEAAADGGAITGVGTYAAGEKVTLRAIPDAGQSFVVWRGVMPVGVDPVLQEIAFVATEDIGLTAVFSADQPTPTYEGRGISVTAVVKGGGGVPGVAILGFEPGDAGKLETLVMAYGYADGGDRPEHWQCVRTVRAIGADETTVSVPLPEGWGTDFKFMRFFFRTGADADSYISDGLLAQWDAIDNTACGEHESAMVWTDRTAGWPIYLRGAEFSDRALDAKGALSGSYARMTKVDSENLFPSVGNWTFEMSSTNVSYSNAILVAGPRSSALMTAFYGRSIYLMEDSASSVGYVFSPALGCRYTMSVGFEDVKAVSFAVDGTENSKKDSTSWGGWYNDRFSIGSGVRVGGDGYVVGGSVNAIRLYGRALKPSEAALNAAVDAWRFDNGGAGLGETVSASDVIKSEGSVTTTLSVSASVYGCEVSGTGEYEVGTVVTLRATPTEPGVTFGYWTGDVPSGVDITSPEISFRLDQNIALSAFVNVPWGLERNESGEVVALTNSLWHFAVSVEGDELTVNAPLSYPKVDTVDFIQACADTGLRLVAFGPYVFANVKSKDSVKRVLADTTYLKSIGDRAFSSGPLLDVEVFPSLTTLGSAAFRDNPMTSFVAPRLETLGDNALWGSSLTNLVPRFGTVMCSSPYVLSYQNKLTGVLTIGNPSQTAIGYCAFYEVSGISEFDIISPISSIDGWGLGNLKPGCVIRWHGKAPTDIGEAAIGNALSTKPLVQIRACSNIAGWTGLPQFVPIADIDAEYKTEAYGYPGRRTIGWLVFTASEDYPSSYAWLVDDASRGLVVIMR